jgi:23S rRNA (cytidine1920-2'-O)/16S rRNA (cytidine1409-2'-O)-methyltransferase
LLIKPQFEVGKAHLNKQGIVKDKKVHKKLLKEYIDFFASLDLHVNDVCKSSVTGRGGNQEYLVYLKSEGSSKGIDIDKIVS